MFGRYRYQEEEKETTFDRATKVPAVRASICNGERVAGFKNLTDGSFEEVAFIQSDADLRAFMARYGIREGEIKTIY